MISSIEKDLLKLQGRAYVYKGVDCIIFKPYSVYLYTWRII
jgi:hypothetical protein